MLRYSRVEARSDGPGKGSKFTVRLPILVETRTPPPPEPTPRLVAESWLSSTTRTRRAVVGGLDEEGPNALLQTHPPVNKFPDFVRALVQRLHVLCPRLGKVKADKLRARTTGVSRCRAVSHLAGYVGLLD